MRDPLHVLLLLADERRIGQVLGALRQAGYDARAGYAQTATAFAATLVRRRWDVVVGFADAPDGHLSAGDAAAFLQRRTAAPPIFALHDDPASPEAQAAVEAGARAVFAPDALAGLGRAVSRARDERRQRRHAAPPPRRPLAPDVADHLPIGVYQTTPDGQIVYANAALAALLGAPSAAALIGRDVAADYGYPRRAFLDAAARDGDVRALDAAWTRPDGRRLHTREHARLVRSADGAPQFYEGTIEPLEHPEVTARHAAAARRHRALAAFHHAADTADDEQALYEAARAAAESLLGLHHVVVLRESVSGEKGGPLRACAWSDAFGQQELDMADLAPWPEHFPEAQIDVSALPDALAGFLQTHRLRPAMALALPRKEVRDGVLLLFAPAGQRFHAAERTDAQHLAEHVGAALDALQHRRALRQKAAAAETHAHHASAVADLAGYGLAFSPEGQILWSTPGTTRLLGTDAPRLEPGGDAARALAAIHPADHRAVFRFLLQARRGDAACTTVRRAPASRSANAETAWVTLHAHAQPDGTLHVAARDVSDERRERDGVAGALAAAERERRFLTRFLSQANHHLRTPLTSILGFASIIAEESGGETQEHACLIEQSSRTLIDQLTAVLTLARPHPAAAEMAPQPTDIGDEIRKTLDLLAPLAEEDGLRFSTTYPKRALEVALDRAAFARLVYGLVGAAIAASASGRIRVDVARRGQAASVTVAAPSLGETDASGAPALVSARALAGQMGARLVLSTRPGGLVTASLRFPIHTSRQKENGQEHEIEELAPTRVLPPDLADAPRAFESLSLAGAQEADLPLPVADLLVLEAEPHEMERAEPRQPASRQARPQPAPPLPDASADTDADADRGDSPSEASADRLSVLAVEDNDDTRLLLERFIGDGIDLDTVADARTALARMARRRYDVLLLDINLGRNQSGADVLRIARTLPGYADVYAVAFTAHDGPEQRARFAAAGFDAHLSKPFSRDDLREVMAGAVGA